MLDSPGVMRLMAIVSEWRRRESVSCHHAPALTHAQHHLPPEPLSGPWITCRSVGVASLLVLFLSHRFLNHSPLTNHSHLTNHSLLTNHGPRIHHHMQGAKTNKPPGVLLDIRPLSSSLSYSSVSSGIPHYQNVNHP
ncbi:uncharacterized protein LOC123505498 [Portunus trituberculatus]|uniref:uncharacterized protein LOC123505498 n=1 Tax=Portunus trituberculatus TaxID=210409 RepID=UPI001E1D1E0D|nr:uncharacterized protein LOC123505498 [Portunus trituberculatus]